MPRTAQASCVRVACARSYGECRLSPAGHSPHDTGVHSARVNDASGPVVLLVEDDASIRETTEMGLRAANFSVVTAVDGEDALAQFAARCPDVVVLDGMLPKLDGFDVCRAIRRTSSVPIVMLTARTDTIDVVVGLEAGADDYVAKPFDLRELVARIRAALRRGRPVADTRPVHRLADLLVDVAAHRVERDGVEIALTPIEFRLLTVLATRPAQVFTRDVLLDQVWDYPATGDTRLVDMAVQRLRAKLGDNPAQPRYVVTVRGVGYRAGSG
jgi:two-component system, OmpR family, response regulator MtrA